MRNLIKDTISGASDIIKGGVSGAREMVQAGMSQARAGAMNRRVVRSMVGPESVFGRVHMNEQKKVLENLQKKGDYKGMRAYMADQSVKAGVKKVKGKWSAL